MTTGAHDAGGGFGRSAGANAARGIMVIVAAVIVGVLLMNRGLDSGGAVNTATGDAASSDSDGGADAAGSDDATGTTTAEGADDASTTTASLAPPCDPSEVAVLVLNGTAGAQGVAKRGTDLLKTQNYITKEPKDADVDGPSVILYQPGYESEAVAVAAVFGVDPALVVQPFDAATSPVADTQGANIIVRIGDDGVIQV